MILAPLAKQQFLDNNGNPADQYKLFSYVASTSTKQTTYTNSTGNPNTNPVILDYRGECDLWLDPTLTYKFVLAYPTDTDPPTRPIWTVDNIPGGYGGTIDWTKIVYDITPAELAVGVTPVNLYIPSHLFTGTVILDRYGTNTTPGTTSMQTALDNAKLVMYQSGCPIELLGTTYLGTLSIRHDSCGVIGQGSAFSTLKNPAGALSVGGVIEVGDTASGGAGLAYVNFRAHGFTIDGNRTNATAPTDDVRGHGIILTDITHWQITDVYAKNCHNAGVIPVIRSNYGHVEATVENCGNATYTAPGFDINSSQYITGQIKSKGCYAGARVLDNCFGINMDFTIKSATTIGFTYNNQSVNESYGNQLRITVVDSGTDGAQIGGDCRNSTIIADISNSGNYGFRVPRVATATDRSSGNTYIVNTRNNQFYGVEMGGDGDNWTINSWQDGRSGAAGTYYAVTVSGQRNNINLNVTDSATPQVRGISFDSNSVGNKLLSFTRNTLVSNYSDAGTGNTFASVIYRGSKTYDAPNLVAGAQTSTTVTVTGAVVGSTRPGDIAHAAYDANIGGITLYAEVTAADTVTVWLTNETAGAIDLGSLTLSAIVISGAP